MHKPVLTFLLLWATSGWCHKPDCQVVRSRLTENLPKDEIKMKYKTSSDEIYDYSKKLETLVNYQIRAELSAFYAYTNMAEHFRRFDMDLPGFHQYFQDAANEELKHANMFMGYQAKRGGSLRLMDLQAPISPEWENGLEALKGALKLERNVTDEVMCLHKVASTIGDQHFIDFLEGNVIPEQYDGMKELSTKIKTLERIGKGQESHGLAEFHFDKTLQKKE